MKKLVFAVAFVISLTACGTSNTSETTIEETDSIEVVTDTVVVDTVAVDSIM